MSQTCFIAVICCSKTLQYKIYLLFWFTFKVNLYLCFHYLCNFQKKIPDPNGPYMSTSQTKIRNFCLLENSEFCLLSNFSTTTAYISLCRNLKYLQKVPCIILNYFNVARFLIFETLYLSSLKTLLYV